MRRHKCVHPKLRVENFEAAAMPHFPDLYRTARLLAQDSTEAEDLVQEVYLEAWKSFHRFQTGTNCRAWLFKILFHRLHHFRRRWAKAAKVEAFENPEDQDSHKQYWFRIMPLRPDFQRSLTANPKWFTLTCTRVTVDVVRPVTSTDRAWITPRSETMLSGCFAGFGTKNALLGEWDDCTLKAGQTPIGLGINNE